MGYAIQGQGQFAQNTVQRAGPTAQWTGCRKWADIINTWFMQDESKVTIKKKGGFYRNPLPDQIPARTMLTRISQTAHCQVQQGKQFEQQRKKGVIRYTPLLKR